MTKTKQKVELDPQLVERGREYVRKRSRRSGGKCRIETIYKHASDGREWFGWGENAPGQDERDAFEAAIWKGNIIREASKRDSAFVYRWVSDDELAEIKAQEHARKALRNEEKRKQDRLRAALQTSPYAKPYRAFEDFEDTEIDPDRFQWYDATVDVVRWNARAIVSLSDVGEFQLDAERLAEVVESGGDVIDAFRVAAGKLD